MAKFLVLFHNDYFKVFNEDDIKRGIRTVFEVDSQKFYGVRTRIEFERRIREEIKEKMNEQYINIHYVKSATEKIREILN